MRPSTLTPQGHAPKRRHRAYGCSGLGQLLWPPTRDLPGTLKPYLHPHKEDHVLEAWGFGVSEPEVRKDVFGLSSARL